MTRSPARDSLLRLRDAIASLQVDACRLAHEQVIVVGGRVKRVSRGIGWEPALGRVGLCAAEHRARQLACAHTSARHVLADGVLVLQAREVLGAAEAQALRREIEEVSDTIHATDWSKGEAEARYALMRERSDAGGVSEAEAQLAELVESHRRCVERLRRLQGHVVARPDAILSGTGPDPERPLGSSLLDHDDAARRQR